MLSGELVGVQWAVFKAGTAGKRCSGKYCQRIRNSWC